MLSTFSALNLFGGQEIISWGEEEEEREGEGGGGKGKLQQQREP